MCYDNYTDYDDYGNPMTEAGRRRLMSVVSLGKSGRTPTRRPTLPLVEASKIQLGISTLFTAPMTRSSDNSTALIPGQVGPGRPIHTSQTQERRSQIHLACKHHDRCRFRVAPFRFE